jgi:hypothetical protein
MLRLMRDLRDAGIHLLGLGIGFWIPVLFWSFMAAMFVAMMFEKAHEPRADVRDAFPTEQEFRWMKEYDKQECDPAIKDACVVDD